MAHFSHMTHDRGYYAINARMPDGVRISPGHLKEKSVNDADGARSDVVAEIFFALTPVYATSGGLGPQCTSCVQEALPSAWFCSHCMR